MKNLVILLLIFTFFINTKSLSAQSSPPIRYFDENNKEITEDAFQKRVNSGHFLKINGEALNTVKLSEREREGTISNVEKLYQKLESATNQKIDFTKPIVVIYHTGKDVCNSSGSSTPESKKKWFSGLEKGVFKISKTKPLYIYKDKSGLEDTPFLPWSPDPDNTIESQFFRYHYPCGSFVVISPQGKYISYFGEYPKEYVWEATKKLLK